MMDKIVPEKEPAESAVDLQLVCHSLPSVVQPLVMLIAITKDPDTDDEMKAGAKKLFNAIVYRTVLSLHGQKPPLESEAPHVTKH